MLTTATYLEVSTPVKSQRQLGIIEEADNIQVEIGKTHYLRHDLACA